MSTITEILGTDLITDSREDINNNFEALNDEKIETSYLDTDTTLAANSDVKIPTQKAVKAYVDTLGNVNASTDAKGIVEEATLAEVQSKSATGGTGARLFINPSNLSVDGATQITGVIPASVLPVPFYQQTLALDDNLSVPADTYYCGSNTTGSVIYLCIGPDDLYRFERDAVSGAYFQTHNVNPTIGINNTGGAIIVIGSYIYVFSDNSTNVICSRFSAADLTGEQVMTVPVLACNAHVSAWTDGTYAYVVSGDSETTSNKWSVSGTTFSAVSTAAVTANIFDRGYSTMWDGTYAYNAYLAGLTSVQIWKLTAIDGSTTTLDEHINLPILSDVQGGMVLVNINSTAAYIGFFTEVYDESAQIATHFNLIPITKP